jgi:hypothetical protein
MSERNDMNCVELADVAVELALGVLTGRERAAALAHLDTCDGCREDVRQLMATSDQLLALLPPAEPPAGFETRVLDRLGLSAPAEAPAPAKAPAPAEGDAELLRTRTRETSRWRRRPARGGTRPRAARPGGRPIGPGGASGPGRTSRPGGASRLRRALAATAVGVAVIVAGLGGWRIGVGSSPTTSSAAGPLTSASLVSATHQNVGDIFLYSGTKRWVYMSVDLGSGDESVTCQVVGTDGRVTTVGSFRLNAGYGGWGSPEPGNTGTLRGARLVSAGGAVLASATFTRS